MSDVKDQTAPRRTLKLNAAPSRTKPMAKPEPKQSAGPKASATNDWASEHKRRMQADMDALSEKRKI
jgi:hypothetical protein